MLTRTPFYDLAEELGSDEDDIDEDGQEYLEFWLSKRVKMEMRKTGKEDDAEEIALEGYSTQSLMMKITLLMSIRYLKLYFRVSLLVLCNSDSSI